MNKKQAAIAIVILGLILMFISCNDINPFYAGGVVPGGNWIYFAEGDTIKRMRLDGSEVESVFNVGYVDTARIQLDQLRQKIYILDIEPGPTSRIYEYNLDGTKEKLLTEHINANVMSMKIDSAAGELYYVFDDGADFRMWKINLESGETENFYTNPSVGNVSLCPNYSGDLYFSFTASIAKINLGSKTYSSLTISPPLSAPAGATIDRATGVIYLYDGMNIEKIVNSNSIVIFGNSSMNYYRNMEISTNENKLFYYHDNPASFEHDLYSIDLSGSGLKKIYTGSFPIGGFDILSK